MSTEESVRADASNVESYSSMWSDLLGTAVSQRWIEAGGIKTRILECGQEHPNTLFFLHGTGGHAEAYVRNLKAHGAQMHVIAIDMIGHGYSELVTRPLVVRDYVAHVIAVMDELGIDSAALSGESLGGWVAARLAIDYPSRVSALVLNTSGGTLARPEVMARIKTLSMDAVENPSWGLVRSRLEWLMADPGSVTDDLVATRLAIYAQDGMVESMVGTLALQDMEIRRANLLSDADLASVAAPTLVLWTTHDPTAPSTEGERIASVIPGAKFELMSDCGHWPQFEDPDEFDKIHLAFLNSVIAVSK